MEAFILECEKTFPAKCSAYVFTRVSTNRPLAHAIDMDQASWTDFQAYKNKVNPQICSGSIVLQPFDG